MKIDPEMIVEVEYTGAAAILHPTVFVEGDSYCCIWGPDPMAGVVGCGNTPDEALEDWEETLRLRLGDGSENDEVVKEVRQLISDRSEYTKQQVQEFENQFYTSKKKR